MEKRVAFLFLLYLASAVSEGQIKYTAHQRVKQGQNWTIECSNYPEYAQIGWRRNGQRLAKEFESGLMYVRTDEAQRISKLFGTKADETQEGNYKCIVGSDPGYSELLVDYDFTFKTLKKSKNGSLELECGHPVGNNRAQWMKEDTVIKSSPVANFVRVHNETGKLQILKSDVEDVYGNYSCSVDGNVVTKYRVVPQPLVLLAPMTSVVEGEKLQLNCKGDLVLGARVRWLFAGKVYNGSEGRVQFLRDERNVNGGQLTVENIVMDDRGDIKCMVSYNWTEPAMTVEGKTFLRVKDKYAALWPFLGICAEVTVLCAIILIYEKKRNKAELEESDTDQSPDTKPTQNKDSDVRQRK